MNTSLGVDAGVDTAGGAQDDTAQDESVQDGTWNPNAALLSASAQQIYHKIPHRALERPGGHRAGCHLE